MGRWCPNFNRASNLVTAMASNLEANLTASVTVSALSSHRHWDEGSTDMVTPLRKTRFALDLTHGPIAPVSHKFKRWPIILPEHKSSISLGLRRCPLTEPQVIDPS
ncbi:unnamed protein product [Durusdinium trenchii]|uniref:Uncharacterized protein n=1 Tax=Durusdinium trenchii TaxID=1381693 RepID=A0ABP0JWQ1_9DINO